MTETCHLAGVGDLESACPTCFNNQRALWCAQTVPKCGSYSTTIENVLLPALSTVTKSEAYGMSPAEALSAAMPQLLAASSLAMPCREVGRRNCRGCRTMLTPVLCHKCVCERRRHTHLRGDHHLSSRTALFLVLDDCPAHPQLAFRGQVSLLTSLNQADLCAA